PIEAGRIQLAQRLQRHAHVALVVVRFVDEPLPALAQLADQLEALGTAKRHALPSIARGRDGVSGSRSSAPWYETACASSTFARRPRCADTTAPPRRWAPARTAAAP